VAASPSPSASASARGRLAPAASAPSDGERIDTLVASGVTIEHILSGRLDSPISYRQDRDEWVVVLEGSAELEIAGDVVALAAGDWILLPATTPHRVLRTNPGTRWLAVHFDPTPPASADSA
jgi:cupin 2 domain-containing protein